MISAEQLQLNTVRIEAETGNGSATGTGFFVDFDIEEGGQTHTVPVIVTNKHVISGGLRGKFRISIEGDERFKDITIENFESRFIKHPDDVDLAILPFGPVLSTIVDSGFTPIFRTLSPNVFLQDSEAKKLDAVEDILMVGYPNGIWDNANNKPVFRKGITATHVKDNYEDRAEFMIDAACFPGSSGSPVFLFNKGTFTNTDGSTVVGSRCKLLGVLYAGPQHSSTGEIKIKSVPTKNIPQSHHLIPNNLGNIIKVNKLLDFEELLADIIRQSNL